MPTQDLGFGDLNYAAIPHCESRSKLNRSCTRPSKKLTGYKNNRVAHDQLTT
jgi:hypothetical protein